MAPERKKLPVGIDSFEKIRTGNYYYLDKTAFIRRLIDCHGEVSLFTRPRRFGKTLVMSMLKSFFEIGADGSLFRGLAISDETEICEAYQGQYPVVFLTLKGVEGESFAEAKGMFAMLIADECRRLSFLLKSRRVEPSDKDAMQRLLNRESDDAELKTSAAMLMRMLHAHYGKRAILLIDEYDVPLDKANAKGYYGRMTDLLRGFFGSAFKTNPDLLFAVMTGCLRISKESIFTGLNNLKVDTVSDEPFGEYFGFTDADVRKMLEDYGLPEAYGPIKEWYDGYRFGNADVYCPWDVISHCDRLLADPDAEPDLYWDNTSSNEIVRSVIRLADAAVRDEIEKLIAGEVLEKRLTLNLTYQELDKKELLWSVLYQTGYLTLDAGSRSLHRGMAGFVIPNREVREIFVEKIREWCSEEVFPDYREGLYREIWNCEPEALQNRIRDILYDTISYYDYHENYYHALLVGLLLDGRCIVRSNDEMGNGRGDVVAEDAKGRRAAILEIKRSTGYDRLAGDSEKALRQIEDRQYARDYRRRGYEVTAYGISFAGKECCVRGKFITQP